MDAFWKQADRWLLKCEAYEETLPIESEKAFSRNLRDGYVLCNLIHKLNPDALDIRQVQRSPAKQKDNLNLFFDACRRFFYLKSEDLFDVEDISQSNLRFANVLRTLSKLSKSPHIPAALKEEGFPRSVERPLSPDSETASTHVYGTIYHDDGGDINDAAHGNPKLNEIFISEMQDPIKLKLLPITDAHVQYLKGITDQSVKSLIHDLVKVHENLKVSARNGTFGKLFSQYSASVDQVFSQFKSREFNREKINRCYPFGKYFKILQSTSKCLHSESEQFTDLQNAMTTLNELDKRIARMCYDWSVNVDELNQLQKKIINWEKSNPPFRDLKQFGPKVESGDLELARGSDSRRKLRTVYLFTRGILILKKKGACYTYKDSQTLENWRIGTIGPDHASDSDQWFCINHRTSEMIYKFFTANYPTKSRWIKSLSKVFQRCGSVSLNIKGHTFKSDNPTSPIFCYVCSELIDIYQYQGHRCENCFKAFHRLCLERSDQCKVVKCMTGSEAELKLDRCPTKTFLVRKRNIVLDESKEFIPLNIGLKWNDKVLHLGIKCNEYGHYSLTRRWFDSVEELTDWYTKNQFDYKGIECLQLGKPLGSIPTEDEPLTTTSKHYLIP